MSLCLTITSYHKITPGQCSEKSMDQGVMAIGRNLDNDWILPDPERLVSGKHCVIQYKDGRYYLTDNSTNGVELVKAGIRLRKGNSEPLQDGEVIRIGDYEIQTRIDFSLPVTDSNPFADSSNSFEALMGRQGAVVNTPTSLPMTPPAHFQGVSAMDTMPDLFDFLTPTTVPPATQPDHVPAEQHDFRPPTPIPHPTPVIEPAPLTSTPVIPEDWDLFSDKPAPVTVAPCLAPCLLQRFRRPRCLKSAYRSSRHLFANRPQPSSSARSIRSVRPTTLSPTCCKPSCVEPGWISCAWTRPRPKRRWKASAAVIG